MASKARTAAKKEPRNERAREEKKKDLKVDISKLLPARTEPRYPDYF